MERGFLKINSSAKFLWQWYKVLQSSPTRLREASFGSGLWSIILDGVFGAFAAPLVLVAQHVDLLAHDLSEQVVFRGLGTIPISRVPLV